MYSTIGEGQLGVFLIFRRLPARIFSSFLFSLTTRVTIFGRSTQSPVPPRWKGNYYCGKDANVEPSETYGTEGQGRVGPRMMCVGSRERTPNWISPCP